MPMPPFLPGLLRPVMWSSRNFQRKKHMPTWAVVPRSCFRIGFLILGVRKLSPKCFGTVHWCRTPKTSLGSKLTTIHKGIPNKFIGRLRVPVMEIRSHWSQNDAARSSPKLLAPTSCFVPGKPCNSMPPELFCCCGWHSSASAQLRASRSSQRAFSTATKMISPMAISSVRATAFSPWAGYLCWDVFISWDPGSSCDADDHWMGWLWDCSWWLFTWFLCWIRVGNLEPLPISYAFLIWDVQTSLLNSQYTWIADWKLPFEMS